MYRCLNCGKIYMKKGKCPECKGSRKEKIETFTCDKFGVPLKTSEAGTFTKEECIRRGFDPIKCQWLLKPELRINDGDN